MYCMERKMKLDSGHVVVPLSEEEHKRITKDFTAYQRGLVRLNPGNWLFLKLFTQYANRIYNFQWKSDDVMIMTYPKCGTTWTQELVWNMRNNPDLNHKDSGMAVTERVPFLDQDQFFDYENIPAAVLKDMPIMSSFFAQYPDAKGEAVIMQMAEKLSSPRTFKTHLPFSFFPKALLDKVQVIYVARNPKDVVVSYYHHHRLFNAMNYIGSFDDFVDYFVNDDLVYSPYWLHVQEAWQKRNHPNVLFLFYEDMKSNIIGQIGKLNDFLGTKLTTDQIGKVAHYCDFSSMALRNNAFLDAEQSEHAEKEAILFNSKVVETDGGFYRKGTTGSWKEKFTLDHEKKIKKWIDEHSSDLEIDFKYSL